MPHLLEVMYYTYSRPKHVVFAYLDIYTLYHFVHNVGVKGKKAVTQTGCKRRTKSKCIHLQLIEYLVNSFSRGKAFRVG